MFNLEYDEAENIDLNQKDKRKNSFSYKDIPLKLIDNCELEDKEIEEINCEIPEEHNENNDILLDKLSIDNNKQKNSYTIEFKIKIVDHLLAEQKKLSNEELKKKNNKYLRLKHFIIEKFHIPKTTLNDWIVNINKYKQNNKSNMKKLPGGGKKSILAYYEQQIIFWIFEVRKGGFNVSINSIIAYLYNQNDYFKTIPFNVLYQRIRRIISRNNLSFRKVSHIGEPLPNEAVDLIYRFLSSIIHARRNLNIDDEHLNRIINCDETSVYYENPDTITVDINGHKEIILNTEGNENKKISVLLSIAGDGTKLPPLLIFKGEVNKINEKQLQKNIHIINKKVYTTCQKKAWCDTQVFLNWYNKIYLKYESDLKEKCLLILDKSPSHCNDIILNEFKKNKTQFILIPWGLTRYLQPLDLGINMPFKKALKKAYLLKKAFSFDNLNYNKKIRPIEQKYNIINIISEIWYGDEIKSTSIINSFKKGGITLNQEGLEDDDWKIPETIINNYSIYDEFENKYKKK